MTKTIVQRVMELTNRNGNFNRSVARRSFRNRSPRSLHNSVLRTARRLQADGYLRRVSAGNYELTPYGRLALAGR